MLHKAIDYICHRFALIYAFGSFAFIPLMLRIISDSFPNVNIFIQILASIGLCEIVSLFIDDEKIQRNTAVLLRVVVFLLPKVGIVNLLQVVKRPTQCLRSSHIRHSSETSSMHSVYVLHVMNCFTVFYCVGCFYFL